MRAEANRADNLPEPGSPSTSPGCPGAACSGTGPPRQAQRAATLEIRAPVKTPLLTLLRGSAGKAGVQHFVIRKSVVATLTELQDTTVQPTRTIPECPRPRPWDVMIRALEPKNVIRASVRRADESVSPRRLGEIVPEITPLPVVLVCISGLLVARDLYTRFQLWAPEVPLNTPLPASLLHSSGETEVVS